MSTASSAGPVPAHRVHAVLVGIERYNTGWPGLEGPARDAMRAARWLLRCGVPPANLRLVVNAAHQDTLRELTAEAATHGLQLDTDPTQNHLMGLFTDDVRVADGDLLVLFWAGHGFMHRHRRLLLTSDAQLHSLRAVDFEALRDYLRSPAIVNLKRQVILLDACSGHFEVDPYETDPVTTNFPQRTPDPVTLQYALLATSPGQAAGNNAHEQAGIFSDVVFGHLDQVDAVLPPDTEQLNEHVERVFTQMRLDGTSAQTPTTLHVQTWSGSTRDLLEGPATRRRRRRALIAAIVAAALTGGLVTYLVNNGSGTSGPHADPNCVAAASTGPLPSHTPVDAPLDPEQVYGVQRPSPEPAPADEAPQVSLSLTGITNRGKAVAVDLSGRGFTHNGSYQVSWSMPNGSTYRVDGGDTDDRGLFHMSLLWMPMKSEGLQGNNGVWPLTVRDLDSGKEVNDQVEVGSDAKTPSPDQWNECLQATEPPEVLAGTSGELCTQPGAISEISTHGFAPEARLELSIYRPDGRRIMSRGLIAQAHGETPAVQDYWQTQNCSRKWERKYHVVVVDENSHRKAETDLLFVNRK